MSKYPTAGVIGATADDVSWIEGRWVGHYGKDEVEEQWSGVAGGTMMGMFRWLRGGAVWFYELIIVERDGEHLMMRLKHFNPGLVGWEEKDKCVEFLLVRLEGREAVFLQVDREDAPWLVYRLEGEDRLVSWFEKEGSAHSVDDAFVYERRG